MTSRILKLVVAAFLAAVGTAVLAAEPKCTASVCSDPTWPEMGEVSPPMTMERHVTDAEVCLSLQEHVAREEVPGGDPEATHEHMDAALFADVTDLEENH